MMSKPQRIGSLSQLCLLAVKVKPDSSSPEISRALTKAAGRRVTNPAVAITLQRLTGQGLMESYLAAPTAKRGGKATTRYWITATGARALRESLQPIDAMRG